MIYLIVGDIPFLQKRALAKLRRSLNDAEPDSFDGGDASAASILDACASLSLLSAQPFVIVRRAEKMPRREQESLLAGLDRIAEEATLVLVAEQIDRRLKLWQRLLKKAELISAEAPPPRDRRAWLAQECRRRRLEVGPDALEFIVQVGLGDLTQAVMLIEKADLYLNERRELSMETIEACASGASPVRIFECAEAIGARDWSRAFSILQSLWTAQESPLAIMALMARHFRILLKALELKHQWNHRQDMARALGVPPFAVSRYLDQAKRYGHEQLTSLWKHFLQTDRALKSSPGKKEWIFESLLWKLRQQYASGTS